mgnify:CR=1 FL=1
MRKYLDKSTFNALVNTMENGTPLPFDIADSVAAGMRQWALEQWHTSVAALSTAVSERSRGTL